MGKESAMNCPFCQAELFAPNPAENGEITLDCPTHGPILIARPHPDCMAQGLLEWGE